MTLSKFIKKSNQVHYNKYDYSKIDKFNYKNKIHIKCPIHGEFFQLPNSHLNGRGCPKCIGRNESIVEIIKKFKNIHNNKYDYKLIDINKKIKKLNKIEIICYKHGVFKQRINSHLLGQGCPECKESYGEKSIKRYLKNNSIKYYTQYKFDKCIFKRHLFFDFYLPDLKICIEYDGKQHYQINEFFGGKKSFEISKIKDEIKNQYCIENNIGLIRIKFNENIIDKLNLSKLTL